MKRTSNEAAVNALSIGADGEPGARAGFFGRLLGRARESQFWRLETALIGGAVVVGLGSAALGEANRTAATRQLLERFKIATVVVAAQDLNAGSRLDTGSVRFAQVLATQATVNTVDAEGLQRVLNRNLTIDLKAGDPLLLTAIEGASASAEAAKKIPPGKRLVTLQIRDRVAQKGWIHPNDRVDIVATMELPERGRTTFTLLQDVTVISVGSATVWNQGQAAQGSEIGFYASPKDVEFIAFAEKHGEFALSLRNPDDVTKQAEPQTLGAGGMDLNKFLDHAAISKASGGGELPVYVKGQKAEKDK